MRHPARTMPYSELSAGLAQAVADKLVYESVGADGLRLYCYTRHAVYEGEWTPFVVMARGLVLDVEAQAVVATPFPKFFNVGEGTQALPDLPFEAFEKVDGSLIIVFHHRGRWQTATKGSLVSEQAKWAARQLDGADLAPLVPGTTYLAEAIYPENRIVVRYDESGLVLLGGYAASGEELDAEAIGATAAALGWRAATRQAFASLPELMAHAAKLPQSEEGFVLRFSDGTRLKVKGEEYRRIHALISRCTPLAMWEAMQAGDDMVAIRKDLPEEFWTDFDAITAILQRNIDDVVGKIAAAAAEVADLSDKEIGLRLASFPADVRGFIFPYRKSGGDLLSGKTRQTLFRVVRPTGNVLPGYAPSYAISRVMDEAS